jgi:two-component system sensor histidine kinase
LIVHKWKGDIWIDSEYTGGARFMFSHPLKIEKE